MRILGIGECNDLASMYAGMQSRGHEVKVFVRDEASHGVFAGILPRTDDWNQDLGWIKDAGEEGVIIFETADQGDAQDQLRAQGFQVIGGSALGDRLEGDREYGQSVLRQAGLRTAFSHPFSAYQDALDFLAVKRERYVLKFNGTNSPRTRNYIAQTQDSRDLVALLQFYASHDTPAESMDFVLMQYIDGIEIGVGGYFNGADFLKTACIDFEHKRFFPGELGELTGEMGTVVTYEGSTRLRELVLEPLKDVLREGGYCGYINVNLIANEAGLWPLEFTSRFGYPGYAICERLHKEPWESVFSKMLNRSATRFETLPGYAVGVVLTVPPFPYRQGYSEISKGIPIVLDEGLNQAERNAIAFAEVEKRRDHLITSGTCGYVGVATGCAPTVDAASQLAVNLARKVYVPNLRYRTDIGYRVSSQEMSLLGQWGYLPVPTSAANSVGG